jgi:uncharacterized membrane protein
MEILAQIQGFLIGLIGWAATAVVISDSTKLTQADQRTLTVFTWTLWMIPALGALVYRNLIDINAAAMYCVSTTLAMALLVWLSGARWRTKP